MAVIPTLEANPCGRLAVLREIRDKIMTGGQVLEAELEQGNGTRRRMKYSAANMDMLNRSIIEAGDACAGASGSGRPSRFAIGGSMS